MKYLISILLLLFMLAACADKKKAPANESTVPALPAVPPPADEIQPPTDDSAAIRTVVKEFYNWYNKNYNKLMAYHLYEGVKKRNAPPYRINWKEVDKYHQFIRTNVPQLGEAFIMNQKLFLQECDSAFKVDKKDEIPYGFDYDWYTNSQEDPEYLVKEVNKNRPWTITRVGETATVAVTGSYKNNGKQEQTTFVILTMKKESDEWKITKIGNEQ